VFERTTRRVTLTEEGDRNLSVPAPERALPTPGTVPLDILTVMAEQERLGTTVVGPPMTLEDSTRL
jgi:hypothetical protein